MSIAYGNQERCFGQSAFPNFVFRGATLYCLINAGRLSQDSPRKSYKNPFVASSRLQAACSAFASFVFLGLK